MKQKNLIGLTLPALLCTLLWGSAFPAVKSGYALFGIGDEAACKLFFAGWRFMLAGVAVLVISVITSRKLVVPTRAQWPGILLLGLVQTTVQYVFFYIGLSHTTGVKGSVISAMATFFAVGISHCLFADDRLNMPKAMGCVLGFVGVLIITLSSLDGLSGGVSLTGEGFMFLAAAASGSGALWTWDDGGVHYSLWAPEETADDAADSGACAAVMGWLDARYGTDAAPSER